MTSNTLFEIKKRKKKDCYPNNHYDIYLSFPLSEIQEMQFRKLVKFECFMTLKSNPKDSYILGNR